MLDERGDPVHLLLEGGDDELFLARNALGRDRARTKFNTSEASTLGVNRIHLQGDPVDWYVFTKMDFVRLGFWALRLPTDLMHVAGFERRFRMVAGFQEDVDYDYGKWSHKAVRLGSRLACAAIRTDTGHLWIWHSADRWHSQKRTPLFVSAGGAQQFFLDDRFYIVGNNLADPGEDERYPITGYDYKGNLVVPEQIFEVPTVVPGFEVRELKMAQGQDGHFFILIEHSTSDGISWYLRILKRHVDAPNIDVVVFEPIALTHISIYDILFKPTVFGKWLFVPWGKRTPITETSPHDGTWAYDLWCFNQETGQAVVCYDDSAISQVMIKSNGQAFARRCTKVTFTMDGTGTKRVEAKVYFGVDRYRFSEDAGTPDLTDRVMMTDPESVFIPVFNPIPGGSLPVDTVDRQTGLVLN